MRNAIYHLVVEEVNEANIIGHKIGFGTASAEDRFWQTVAKHPFSQTCRELRKEFDPIHRRRVMTIGVACYHLDLENYDLDRLGDFVRLVKPLNSVFLLLLASMKAGNKFVRFQLTQEVEASVEQIRARSWSGSRLLQGPDEFSKLAGKGVGKRFGPVYFPSAEVVLNLRTRAMTTAEKKLAISMEQHSRAMKALEESTNDLQKRLDNTFLRYLHDSKAVKVLKELLSIHYCAHRENYRTKELARGEKAAAAKTKDRENFEKDARGKLEAEFEAKLETRLRAEKEKWMAEMETKQKAGVEEDDVIEGL